MPRLCCQLLMAINVLLLENRYCTVHIPQNIPGGPGWDTHTYVQPTACTDLIIFAGVIFLKKVPSSIYGSPNK